MALATTCPQCKTSFKVVPDQLKLRRGMVRCGACQHVFSGIDHLRYVDDAPKHVNTLGSNPAAGSRPRPRDGSGQEPPTEIAPATGIAPQTDLKTAFFLPETIFQPTTQIVPPGPMPAAIPASIKVRIEGQQVSWPGAAQGSASNAPAPTPPPIPPSSMQAAADRLPPTPSGSAHAPAAEAPGIEAPAAGSPAATHQDEPARYSEALKRSADAVHRSASASATPPSMAGATSLSASLPTTHGTPVIAPELDDPRLDWSGEYVTRSLRTLPGTDSDDPQAGAADFRSTPIPATDVPPAFVPASTIPTSITAHRDRPRLDDPATESASGDGSRASAEMLGGSARTGSLDGVTTVEPPWKPAGRRRPQRTANDGSRPSDPERRSFDDRGESDGMAIRHEARDASPRDTDDDDAIDFFSGAHRTKGFNSRLLPLGWLAAALLSILLLIQLALGGSNWIASSLPGTQALLGRLLAPLSLRVGPPRDLESLTIESFELQSLSTPGSFRLSALLRNRAGHDVRWPAMELSLTDNSGGLLSRKVIMPADYLRGASASPARGPEGIRPRSELPLRLGLEIPDLSPAGYSVVLFYP